MEWIGKERRIYDNNSLKLQVSHLFSITGDVWLNLLATFI